jgi:AmmeMemoRadiSam system protein B
MKHVDDGHKGELLKYYTSADVVGDYSNAVGYASIVFR